MRRILLGMLVIGAAACGSGLLDSTGETGYRDVGPAGGEVKASGVRLVIPPGALSDTTRVTIREVPATGAVGSGFEVAPKGLRLLAPARVFVGYDPTTVPDASAPARVRLALRGNGRWNIYPATSVNVAGRQVAAETAVFGTLAVVQPPPPAPETCRNGLDDDLDGATDCDDADCFHDAACPPPVPRPELDCADGFDDDGDGPVDCADADCFHSPACPPPSGTAETACANGADDDGDGAVDCNDADCAYSQACPPPTSSSTPQRRTSAATRPIAARTSTAWRG